MKSNFKKSGYSLVEVLVSISVLLLAIVGPMTIASQGIKSSNFSLEQNTAFFLAQEGIEAVFSLRNDSALGEVNGAAGTSWDWFDDLYAAGGLCNGLVSCKFGIDFRDDSLSNNFTALCDAGNEENCRLYYDETNTRAVYTHVAGTQTQFVRIITIESKTNYAMEVTVEVKWNSSVFGGNEQTVSVTSVLYDLLL